MEPEINTNQLPPESPHKHFCCSTPNCKCNKFLCLMAVVLVLVIVSGLSYLYGLKSTPQPVTPQAQRDPALLDTPTVDPTGSWVVYTNDDYDFQIKYPDTYQEIGKPVSLSQNNLVPLVSLEYNSSTFDLYLDNHAFSPDYLKKYAPTGSEGMSPVARATGNNTFYYYGPGGGGVNYPDQYFYNLNTKILYLVFNGPYTDANTPPPEAKALQEQILSTLQSFDFAPVTEAATKQGGYIKKVTLKDQKYYLDIDYIEWFSEPEATKACIADGKCTDCGNNSHCTPNGYYIRNINPLIRTFEIVPNAKIQIVDGYHIETPSTISLDMFYKLFNGQNEYDDQSNKKAWYAGPTALFSITLQDNKVLAISQSYTP